MTDQDRQEIRQMILAEFRQRGLDNIGVATASAGPSSFATGSMYPIQAENCVHSWFTVYTMIGSHDQCTMCGNTRNQRDN
jgi:hypothetical protein